MVVLLYVMGRLEEMLHPVLLQLFNKLFGSNEDLQNEADNLEKQMTDRLKQQKT